MTLHVLMWGVNYEGDGLIGVYTTPEKAHEMQVKWDKIIKDSEGPGEFTYIMTCELDNFDVRVDKYGWNDPAVDMVKE